MKILYIGVRNNRISHLFVTLQADPRMFTDNQERSQASSRALRRDRSKQLLSLHAIKVNFELFYTSQICPDDVHSISEFLTLFSKTVAERTKPGQRQDVEEQGAA
jgi:hypothetical protein